jgi:hypothetical protein
MSRASGLTVCWSWATVVSDPTKNSAAQGRTLVGNCASSSPVGRFAARKRDVCWCVYTLVRSAGDVNPELQSAKLAGLCVACRSHTDTGTPHTNIHANAANRTVSEMVSLRFRILCSSMRIGANQDPKNVQEGLQGSLFEIRGV